MRRVVALRYLAALVSESRGGRKITKEKLAGRAGVSKRVVSLVENRAAHRVKPEEVARVLDALHLSAEEESQGHLLVGMLSGGDVRSVAPHFRSWPSRTRNHGSLRSGCRRSVSR